jgi:YgiT-type zinc finger domain-containing protein
MPTKTQPCPACGGVMHFREGDDTITYKGQTQPIKMLGWWCEACDEAIFEGASLAARERAYLKLKAQVPY